MSPKERVKGANTVLRGVVRAPEGFSEGKPEAAKPRGRRLWVLRVCPKKIPQHSVGNRGTLLRGQLFHSVQ